MLASSEHLDQPVPEKLGFADEDFENIFAEAGWDAGSEVAAAESETSGHVARAESAVKDLGHEIEPLRIERDAALAKNGKEMRDVAAESRRAARKVIDDVMKGQLNEQKKAQALALFVGTFPKEVVGSIRDFGMSHANIVDFVEALPDKGRGRLLEAFGIPQHGEATRGGEEPEEQTQKIANIIEGEVVLEKNERVEHFEQASKALAAAITEEFPERAARDAERHWAERELQGKISEYFDLGEDTATKPMVLKIDGRELPAVYKPIRREAISVEGGTVQLRPGIEMGGMAAREALASLIDRALGWEMVPTTVFRQGPEGLGSVQEWTVGRLANSIKDKDKSNWSAEKYHDGLRRIGYADHLLNRSDGHPGNFGFGFDGKPFLIDNGPVLAKQGSALDRTYSEALEVVHGTPPPQDMVENARKFLSSEKTKKALHQAFTGLLGEEEGQVMWEDFIERMIDSTKKDYLLPRSEMTYAQQYAWAHYHGQREFTREEADVVWEEKLRRDEEERKEELRRDEEERKKKQRAARGTTPQRQKKPPEAPLD